MGLLTEFFAATPEQAATVDPDHWSGDTFGLPTLLSGGLEPTVMLGALEEVLVGTPFDDTLDAGMRLGADSHSWVYEVRAPLQAALSAEDVDWSAVAERLVAAGEAGPGDVGALYAFLVDLAGFAQAASAGTRRLYCWGSL